MKVFCDHSQAVSKVLTEIDCQNLYKQVSCPAALRATLTIDLRLWVKGNTAPLQNGFCKTAPQRYETAQMQSRGGKDTMCVRVAVD